MFFCCGVFVTYGGGTDAHAIKVHKLLSKGLNLAVGLDPSFPLHNRHYFSPVPKQNKALTTRNTLAQPK